MPNRIIKESLRDSRKVNSLTDIQFRLWIYLITYVDDYGRGSADPEILKGHVFTRRRGITEKQICDALDGLANAGMIEFYEVEGEPFLYFPNWSKHQRIQTKKSKFPDPSEKVQVQSGSRYFTVIHGDSPSESNPNPNPNTETKEKGANAPQKKGAPRFVRPTVDDVADYCRERGNHVDPQSFVDYYESKGWVVGKSPMKDWKACVRTWERNGYDDARVKKQDKLGAVRGTDYDSIMREQML